MRLIVSWKACKRIPHCHLKAKFSGDLTAIPDLECDIDVLGARQPHNKFVIDSTPSVEVSDYLSGVQPSSIPTSPLIDQLRLKVRVTV